MNRLEKIALGTIEPLVVELTDRLANVTDLASSNARYTVVPVSDGDPLYDDEPATLVDGMTVYCRIDTATVIEDEGDYDLFLRLDIGGDTPFLKCGRFRVD